MIASSYLKNGALTPPFERTHLKEIPHLKIKGQLRFRKREIDRWLDTFRVPAVDTPEWVLKAVKQWETTA